MSSGQQKEEREKYSFLEAADCNSEIHIQKQWLEIKGIEEQDHGIRNHPRKSRGEW